LSNSTNKFTHSAVGTTSQGPSRAARRTSTSTYLPSTGDPTITCIQHRALLFQSPAHNFGPSHLEPLQLVRYDKPGQEYHLHNDWFNPSTDPTVSSAKLGGNRVSSFFAYVYIRGNDTTGSGTQFPLVDAPKLSVNGEGWCDIVDCDRPWEEGITFRPVEGNAIYWENLNADGVVMANGGGSAGDPRVVHAGLPLTSGDKIGMNIWTREAPLGEDVRGGEGKGWEYPDV